MPASHTDEPSLNEFSNQNEGTSEQEDTITNSGSTDTNYVNSPLPEYQPLLQSTSVQPQNQVPGVKKFQRKQSTFVVTPVSILENDDVDASKPKLVSTL